MRCIDAEIDTRVMTAITRTTTINTQKLGRVDEFVVDSLVYNRT